MKVIDLLNKIANKEEVPKEIRIDHWCYKFEWKDNIKNYYDDGCEVLLTEVISLDGEELNYEVHIVDDELVGTLKVIEKLEPIYTIEQDMNLESVIAWQKVNNKIFQKKIDELIDYINRGNDE